jgi:hypothetical protein
MLKRYNRISWVSSPLSGALPGPTNVHCRTTWGIGSVPGVSLNRFNAVNRLPGRRGRGRLVHAQPV